MSASSFRLVDLPPEESPRAQLRLFQPQKTEDPPSLDWTLPEFFRRWYCPQMRADKKRKPVKDTTLERRGDAIQWWSRLMATEQWPEGPPIGSLSEADLEEFERLLVRAEFRRGSRGKFRKLAATTQKSHLKEVLIVIQSTGPRSSRRSLRAGLLSDPPGLWIEPPPAWPKQTWSIDEARKIFAAIANCDPVQPRSRAFPRDDYLRLARCTLGLWYYSGHRFSTYRNLSWEQLRCEAASDGSLCWFMLLLSVKTGKPDKVAIHPHLLSLIEECRGLDDRLILPWPVCRSALQVTMHEAWQDKAGLPELRRFSPQAWRRLHQQELNRTGYGEAKEVARVAAGHSDVATTEGSYFSVRNAHVLRLSPLA